MDTKRLTKWVSGSLVLPSILMIAYGIVAGADVIGTIACVVTLFSIVACIETIDAE